MEGGRGKGKKEESLPFLYHQPYIRRQYHPLLCNERHVYVSGRGQKADTERRRKRCVSESTA